MFIAASASQSAPPGLTKPTIIGTNGSQTSTVTIPAHQVGDLICIFAWRSLSAAPTKPTASGTVPAWVDIANVTASAPFVRSAYFVATATNHTSGTWTSAATMQATVIRGEGVTPTGGKAASNGGGAASTSNTAPAVTLVNSDDTSLLLAFHGASTGGFVSGSGVTPPTGWTRLNSQTSSCLNSKTIVTSGAAVAQAQASNAFAAVQVEIIGGP